MGQIKFTPLQEQIFGRVATDIVPIHPFYFTGGTALAVFYFGHRDSDDLDFFSDTPFEIAPIAEILKSYAKQNSFLLRQVGEDRVYFFEMYKDNIQQIKVDFACYPHPKIETRKKINGIEIDSLRDIGINKLHTITSRTEVKDFVDLYFLLQKFTFWDLFYGLEVKFGIEYDLLTFAQDFTKVEEFTYLPKMHVPLTLEELKAFFLSQAKKVSARVVK